MSTDTKKYRLLKDLPDAKAGTELISDGQGNYDYKTPTDSGWYNEEYVENNPTWFELVEPSKEVSPHINKDWEITAVQCYGDEVRRLVNGEYRIFDDWIGWTWEELSQRKDTSIKSVRRLSDNAVFSVGDEVADIDDTKNNGSVIDNFELLPNHVNLIVNFTSPSKLKDRFLYQIKKLPTNPIPDTPVKVQFIPMVTKGWYQIDVNDYEIPEDKFPAIKQAIEAALNEDTVYYNQLGEKVTDYKEEDVDRGMPVTKTMNGVEAYNTGFAQGVKFCEKYGIPKHQIGAGKSTKPPLGLLPKHIWEEQRIWDIAAAVERYQKAGKEIPSEWLDEDKVLRKQKTDTVVQDKFDGKRASFYAMDEAGQWETADKELTKQKMDELIKDFHKQPLQFYSPPKRYSQEEVDTMTEDTWNQCRCFVDGCAPFESVMPFFKYKTFSDYKNSLQPAPVQPQEKVSTNNDDVACISINEIKSCGIGLGQQRLLDELSKLVNKKLKQ